MGKYGDPEEQAKALASSLENNTIWVKADRLKPKSKKQFKILRMSKTSASLTVWQHEGAL
jgi:hypothetical protein